jgi:hypothetical protein
MKKQLISIALLVTILLQSCVVYQDTTVSINEAHNRGKVKVKSNRGVSYEFSNIEMRDSIYYGVNKNGDIPLKTELITSIYLQDINKSKTQTTFFWVSFTVLMVVGGIAILILGLQSLADELNNI